ncbi:MAG: tyrosine-type recombinase/integrase [Vulcanimicrobiaceae bacterium]
MIDADDPFPFRIVVPLLATKTGRRRMKIVKEFKTEAEADKELARLIKTGDTRTLSVEKLSRGRRTLGTYATKKEAEKAERDALTAKDRGIDVAPTDITLDALFERYVAAAEARGASGTTIRGYREIWKRCAAIVSLPVAKLKPVHLAELYSELARSGWSGGRGPLSARSIRHTHALIDAMLRWTVRLEIVLRNVADAVQPPKRTHTPARAYERDEAARLIAEGAKTRHGPLIVFAFETGLRRGELAGLKWTDLHIEQKAATIRGAVAQVPERTWYKATKTERVARIALSDHAVEALRVQRVQQAKDKLAAGPHYDDQGFVFAPEEGGMPSPGAITHAVRRIVTKAGLTGRGLHSMRHSTGTWLIRAGVDVRTVAALLRHSSPATTLNVYAHEVEGAQADAVRHLLGANGNRMATAVGSDPKNPS